MRGMRGWCVAVVLAVGGVSALPGSAAAQWELGVFAGAAPYDLSGTGTGPVAGVRVGWSPVGLVSLEAGTSWFAYETQGEDRISMLLPEVGARVALGFVPVYVGGGIGHSVGLEGGPENDLTLYGAIGFDVSIPAGWSLRPEMRVRAVDPWAGTVAEFTIGIARGFSR